MQNRIESSQESYQIVPIFGGGEVGHPLLIARCGDSEADDSNGRLFYSK